MPNVLSHPYIVHVLGTTATKRILKTCLNLLLPISSKPLHISSLNYFFMKRKMLETIRAIVAFYKYMLEKNMGLQQVVIVLSS